MPNKIWNPPMQQRRDRSGTRSRVILRHMCGPRKTNLPPASPPSQHPRVSPDYWCRDSLSLYAAWESHYRIFPGRPRSFQTDVFALGCLIYEIAAGKKKKPYEEIDEDNWEQISSNHAAGKFPCLDGLNYRHIIEKCWTFRYNNAQQVLLDIQSMENPFV